MSKATKVIGIARVSTARQSASGLGLEDQRVQVEAYCRAHGLELAGWFVEGGVSGTTPLAKRPVLLDALGAVRELGASHLVVSCHDRLARSVLTVELVKLELARTGATLISADGSGNDQSAEGKLISTILCACAEFEAAKGALRVRAAIRARRARGGHVGPKPFGRDAGEQAALGRCLELAGTGLGQAAIAVQLNAEGHTTRRGGPIDRTWVNKRLKIRRAQP